MTEELKQKAEDYAEENKIYVSDYCSYNHLAKAYIAGATEATKELDFKRKAERKIFQGKVDELLEQIEKMKCCYNCSKWNDGECKDCPSPIYTMADFNCDKWELAEK